MAENSGFFRSINGDRKYSVSFLAKWAGCFVSNGVYNGELAVTAGENMQVVVPAGRAWLGPNGERYKYENDSDKALPIANADGVLARKDTVVLRWDVNERSITAQVLTGEFSSNPVAPAISRTAEQYDLKLAEIYIAPGATAITQAVITDTRLDSAVCGIVTSIVTQVDTSTFYNQIQSDLSQFKAKNQAEFTTWFQSIRDVLDESAAGNLLNMVQTHEADTVAHVTQEDHDKISGAVQSATLGGAAVTKSGTELQFPECVQGNTKAWIATSVSMADNNLAFMLTVPNFIFSEGCQVTFRAPVAPTANPWCGVNIDGVPYMLRKLSHEDMDGEEWLADTSVTVTLSATSIPNGINQTYKTAFFKGGAGSVKEAFDFPLSMQTAAPTPVNTNHIWIHNDANRVFAIDEAIRSEWDNYYAGIVDNTDSNYIHIESPKALTNGNKTVVFNRHLAKDATPWHLGYTEIAKKYGAPYVIDSWNKWPRIYSKVNGVVDMEDAQRWNGSAWQWLSQKGHYLAFQPNGYPLQLYNRTNETLVRHADISSTTTTNRQNAHSFSPDGNYLASRDADGSLHIFKREGDSFVLNSTFGIGTSISTWQLKFSPGSDYLAWLTDNGLTILKKQSDGTWVILWDTPTMNPLINAHTPYCATWAGNLLIVGGGLGYVYVLSRSGDGFSRAQELFADSNQRPLYGMAYRDGYLILSFGSGFVRLYRLQSASLQYIDVYSSLGVTGQSDDPAMLPGNRVVLQVDSGLVMFTFTDTDLAYVGIVSNYSTARGYCIATEDGNFVFSKSDSSIIVYSITGTTAHAINILSPGSSIVYTRQFAFL
ncbi:MAG: hypothetical protein E7519_11910 [Ruminococcaceae bacterium]|nr:hypothetical protein [Oscillospiraceae bacterium]